MVSITLSLTREDAYNLRTFLEESLDEFGMSLNSSKTVAKLIKELEEYV
jgi:hypothetical protein